MTRFKRIAFMLLCYLPAIAAARPVFDISRYGAVGDGKTLNTEAIQKAIEMCSSAGGGVIRFPAGKWLSGTILLKSGVTLQLAEQAVLLGSTNINDYKLVDGFTDGSGSDMGYAFIAGIDARKIGITGKGTIDGQGKALLAAAGKSKRPFLIRFVRCNSVAVQGVRLQASAAWTMHFFNCEKVNAEDVTIRSWGLSNNDGIDIDCSRQVRIKNCDIESSDDALCLKATGPFPCKDIVIDNIKVSTNQGAIKIGTESVGDFNNIRVSNLHVATAKGIKLYSVDGAHMTNVSISNVDMDKVALPVMVRLGARLKTFRPDDKARQPGSIENLKLSNITAKHASVTGILVSGIPGHLINRLSLKNIAINLSGGGTIDDAKLVLKENEQNYPEINMFGGTLPASGAYIRHAKNVKLTDVHITLDAADARPALIGIDLAETQLSDLNLPANNSAQPLIRLQSAKNITFRHTVKPEAFCTFGCSG